MWQVGIIVGLMCGGLAWWDLLCGKVFAGWVGVMVGLHTVVGLMCSRTCTVHWGGAVARFLQGRLVLKLGLYAMLGWHWSIVTASLAHCDRVVAMDLHMANGGSGGHGLCAARWWWWWRLVRLEGQGMEVGIMWWMLHLQITNPKTLT